MSLTPLTFPVKILAAALSSTGNRMVLPDIKHWDSKDLTSGEVGTVLYAAIQDFARTKMEIVELDATTLSVATTTGILINKRACSFTGGTVASAETAYNWSPNESYVMLGSNPPQLITNLVDLDEAQTVTGLKTFSGAGVLPQQDVYTAATNAKQFIAKGQLDAAVLGIITADKITVEATAGETVAAGELVYYDTTDKEWKLADADVAATVENSYLGLAQGAGTNGNAISGGVLISGLDENQTGMTAGDIMYASNTAGEIANTAGTQEVTVGIAKSATKLYFNPRFNQQLTEDQQDALDGTGTPSASNKFVTDDDQSKNQQVSNYATAVAGTADVITATFSPAPTSLVEGMRFTFKAGGTNTGAVTFNPSGLGAKAVVLSPANALTGGEIQSGATIELLYDGTNLQMSVVPAALIGEGDAESLHVHNTIKAKATDIDNVNGDGTYDPIVSYALPAGILGTEYGVRVRVYFALTSGLTSGSAPTCSMKLALGSTDLADFSITPANSSPATTDHYFMEFTLMNDANAAVQIGHLVGHKVIEDYSAVGEESQSSFISYGGLLAATENTALARTIALTMACTVGDDVSQISWNAQLATIEIIRSN